MNQLMRAFAWGCLVMVVIAEAFYALDMDLPSLRESAYSVAGLAGLLGYLFDTERRRV